MKVAILNNAGFCVGGTNTLCFEYAKLGFDVFIRNRFRPHVHISKYPNNIFIYSSIEDLIASLINYDRILTVDLWGGGYGYDKMFDDFITIRDKLPNLEICHVHCQRDISTWPQVLRICKNKNFSFYHVFSLNPLMLRFPNSSVLDVNAFILPSIDWIEYSNKNNIIFSAGRVEYIKGINKYIVSITPEFLHLSSDFIYLHEGLKFSCNNNQIKYRVKNLFDTNGVKNEWIEFKSYGQPPEKEKFNVYPTYNVDDIYERWKYYFAGVCCVLGVKSGYKYNKSLLVKDRVIADEKERDSIEKSSKYWNESLEYTEMEKIASGVPVLFSRPYSKLLGFNDERVIYDKFLDIPGKVSTLFAYYDDVRNQQFNWLLNKLDSTNKNIISKFTEDF